MPNQTNRLQLQLPLGSDQVPELRLAITNIANSLDTSVTVTKGTLAAIPAPGLAGRRYYATDKNLELWDNGTSWQPTGPALPIGAMAAWSVNTDPVDADGVTRWMVADGRSISKTTYATLNSLYGTASYPYGSSGGNFNLPDTRGRVLVGPDTGIGTGAAGRVTANNTIAAASGEQNHQLANSEMPAHSHGGATGGGTTGTDSPDHSHTAGGLWYTNNSGPGYSLAVSLGSSGWPLNWGAITTGGASARHAHGVPSLAIGVDGSSGSHNTLQPYIVTHHIVRVL